MDYLSVAEARDQPGLKLVLTAGVPGPWGEAAKAILDHKGLEYIPVRQEAGGDNPELRAWTGQDSAPVAVVESVPPVSHWLDLWMLAERLAPKPALVPDDPALQAEAVGTAALIAGVYGLGWQRRLQLLAPGMAAANPPEMIARMAAKYGWSAGGAAAAEGKLLAILAHLDARLAAQEAAGSEVFIGDALSAVDLYWAHFAGMICPLPPEDNPMPDFLRAGYSSGSEALLAAVTPRLLAHRDRMFREHLTLPMDF